MAHAYFQEDGFSEKFDFDVKKMIDMEKEKEVLDRVKRKRTKRIPEMNHRGTPPRRDSKHSLEEAENKKYVTSIFALDKRTYVLH